MSMSAVDLDESNNTRTSSHADAYAEIHERFVRGNSPLAPATTTNVTKLMHPNDKEQVLSSQHALGSQIGFVMASLEHVQRELTELKMSTSSMYDDRTSESSHHSGVRQGNVSKLLEWRLRSETWTNEVNSIIEKLSVEQEQTVLSNLAMNDRLATLEDRFREHNVKLDAAIEKQEKNWSWVQDTVTKLQFSSGGSSSSDNAAASANINKALLDRIANLEKSSSDNAAASANINKALLDRIANLEKADMNEVLLDRIASLEKAVGQQSQRDHAKDLQQLAELHIRNVSDQTAEDRQFLQLELSQFSKRLELCERLSQPNQELLSVIQDELSRLGTTLQSLQDTSGSGPVAAELSQKQIAQDKAFWEQANNTKLLMSAMEARISCCEREVTTIARSRSTSVQERVASVGVADGGGSMDGRPVRQRSAYAGRGSLNAPCISRDPSRGRIAVAEAQGQISRANSGCLLVTGVPGTGSATVLTMDGLSAVQLVPATSGSLVAGGTPGPSRSSATTPQLGTRSPVLQTRLGREGAHSYAVYGGVQYSPAPPLDAQSLFSKTIA